jgi:hypothetical protein
MGFGVVGRRDVIYMHHRQQPDLQAVKFHVFSFLFCVQT